MWDIEKARKNGASEDQIKILESMNENMEKEQSCNLHEFERTERIDQYICKNCGCTKSGSYVFGYNRAMEHAKEIYE